MENVRKIRAITRAAARAAVALWVLGGECMEVSRSMNAFAKAFPRIPWYKRVLRWLR